MVLTKEQRHALLRVWQRGGSDLSYRQFRRTVESGFCMDGAVIVPWCGMWLAIETDGYTHS
jgi:hypothetical protein